MPIDNHKVSAEKEPKFERWNPPSMDSANGKVFKHEKEEKAKAEAELAAAETNIPTADEIEMWHKEAHEEGYQQGLKQAAQEIAEQKQKLLDVIAFFERPLQSLNEEVEEQLNLLAVTLAQQLVRRELRTEPGEVIAVIRESVKLLPASSRKIRVYLHPEDAAIVRSALQMDDKEDEQSWKLLEDRTITRGGCQIKSDQSVINATLEHRLQALAASILGGERLEDGDDAAAD